MYSKRRQFAGLVCAVFAGLILLLADDVPAGAAPTTITVNSASDPGGGACDVAECTLREAIILANGNAGNDTILFAAQPGGYLIEPASALPPISGKDGITIDGSGTDVSLIPFPLVDDWNGLLITTDPGFLLQNVVIRNLRIQSFEHSGIRVCAGMIQDSCTYDISGVEISDVFSNNDDYGISVTGANVEDVTVTNALVDSNGLAGISVTGTSLSGIAISGAETIDNPTGVELVADDVIENVSITDSPMSFNTDYDVHIESATVISDVTVSGLNTSGADVPLGRESIWLNAEDLNDVLIEGNEIADPATAIDVLSTRGIRISIVGNTVTKTRNYEGVRVWGTNSLSDVSITDNTITQARTSGIVATTSNQTIEGVRIERNKVSLSGATGIGLQGPSLGENVISLNEVSGSGTVYPGNGSGILVFKAGAGTDTGQVTISGNTSYENSSHGIHVSVPQIISRNHTYSNGLLGIKVETPTVQPPVITGTTVGTVNGTACPGCLVELFISDKDPSGYGEGKDWHREGIAEANGSFSIIWCFQFVDPPEALTGTATRLPSGNDPGGTSEFSLNFVLAEPLGYCPTPSPSPSPSPSPGPSATASPTAAPTPTPSGGSSLVQGNVDCDPAGVTAVDALKELRYVAQLGYTRTQPCPGIGEDVASQWGDVDCDDEIDAVDALKILRFVAALGYAQNEPCTDIGAPEN